MIYVMSDIHGQYEKYIQMLEKINFSDEDELFILGDVVDRGPEPIKILQDMMGRSNVYPIMGNHDFMAYCVLKKLMVEITEENCENYLDDDFMRLMLDWQMDGGSITMEKFQALPKDERSDILDYMSEFSYYEAVDVDDKTFLLVHAGLGNYGVDKGIDEYSLEELAFSRPDFDKKYFADDSIYVVCGHTPTLLINGKPEIYKNQNNICIDCGATFDSGRLACLCLDTMEEFYV